MIFEKWVRRERRKGRRKEGGRGGNADGSAGFGQFQGRLKKGSSGVDEMRQQSTGGAETW